MLSIETGSSQREATAGPPRPPALATVVAIPARNEAGRLPACLAALAAQCSADGTPFDLSTVAVVVLVNNSTDDTAAAARGMAETLPFRLLVEEVVLPPGLVHAGGARRRAMDRAASLLGDAPAAGAALLTTDADGRVANTWLAANRAALAAGADAVAGAIEPDPEEAAACRRRCASARRGKPATGCSWTRSPRWSTPIPTIPGPATPRIPAHPSR